MSKNKKSKVTKEDLREEERKKLIEEEKEKQREKEKIEKEEKEEFMKRKKEWKKQELKKKIELIKTRKIKEEKKEKLEKKKMRQKLYNEKELEDFKKVAFIETKPDEIKLISISAERIKYRENKIKKNLIALKILNKIEQMLFGEIHKNPYKSLTANTVKHIITNIKEETNDVGPLDVLHDYIYSLQPKSYTDKLDYLDILSKYLQGDKYDIINKLDSYFYNFPD